MIDGTKLCFNFKNFEELDDDVGGIKKLKKHLKEAGTLTDYLENVKEYEG
jgi:hypothetical protein